MEAQSQSKVIFPMGVIPSEMCGVPTPYHQRSMPYGETKEKSPTMTKIPWENP